MDKELKTAWVSALKSEEYTQCQAQLYDSVRDSYCCLGVLCRVAGLELSEDDEETFYDIEPTLDEDGNRIDGESTQLPTSFREKAGIPEDVEVLLIKMNDDEEKTFSEIAEWITENL